MLLSVLTLIFVIVVAAMAPVSPATCGRKLMSPISLPLLVALIPTTIAGAAFRHRDRRDGPHNAVQCAGNVRQAPS